MGDQKQLFLFGQALPGNDSALLAKIQGCANFRNRYGAISTKALDGIPACDILQIAVGKNHVAFLFSDFRVARLSFDIVHKKVETSSGATSSSTQEGSCNDTSNSTAGQSSHASVAAVLSTNSSTAGTTSQSSYAAATTAAKRTAKIRRVMMAARRPGGFCGRTGVIVDRARPLVPASSIPEELIAQAQVVLQGKSRDVIVRELQRTNLNVNEAVNNLLSRDDDEGDELDETREAYLHEELLSLLDAGLRTDSSGSAAIIDHENIYASPEGYEYLVSRDLAKRRDESKYKDRGKEGGENASGMQDRITFADELQFWKGVEGTAFPTGVTKFLKIGAMNSVLMCLGDDGQMYGWPWTKNGDSSNTPHSANGQLLSNKSGAEEQERIIDMETSAWRTVVLTSMLRIGSFMDMSCGDKISSALLEPLIDMPDGETVERLHVSSMFSVVKTTNDRLYWRGLYPYNERRKLFEKSRTKLRKYVTFDVNEIVEGAEVRTKSAPIYSAGCVGINFSNGTPMVGTLMESAWTLDETCRFRIQTPEQYDQVAEDMKEDEKKSSFNISVRKRAAPSDEGPTSGEGNSIREAAWSLKDVVFVKEEIVNDIAVVQVVDGAYCGVVFKSNLEKQKSVDSSNILKRGLRLMRKDDLVTVPSTGKSFRAPDVFQQQLNPIQLPSNIRRIISMAVDNTGFRILVEKKNRVHLIRMSCIGKLFSDHVMPICLNTLCKSENSGGRKPMLENYGDDGILMLRDATGHLIPLLRNAAGGFCEPPFIGMAHVHDASIGLRYLKGSEETYSAAFSSSEQYGVSATKITAAKNANRIMILAVLVAPSPNLCTPVVPSLMQAVLYCNLESVRGILRILSDLGKSADAVSIIRAEIVDARTDGNRNILHAAVMNSYSITNKDQADVKMDKLQLIDPKEDCMDTTDKNEDLLLEQAKAEAFVFGGPLTNKDRQLNAIEIIKLLVADPLIQVHFHELMAERDANEQTPFNCAIQMRAYSAASILWKAIEGSKHEAGKSLHLRAAPYINGLKADDSPLFVLCYNDTCSFTWTGEEHVNQDIFECKTCGLTGTLCCCTECAYTCHRNHDCRLKRTSPTAYCDCWEKCPCKALVSGNPIQREYLLTQILRKTKLISHLNSRGEHLLLFLARTVGRQLVEQENFVRHVSKIRAPNSSQPATENTSPEHDLEPPKFSRLAFDLVLKNWGAVKSLLEIGLKHTSDDAIVVEDIYHLSEQNGSTHLDKFVFTLLARCQEAHLDALLNTLIAQANLMGDDRDARIDEFISRFVRSIIRLFTLIIVVSPPTAGVVLSAIADTLSNPLSTSISTSTVPSAPTARPILSNYRAVAISGMLSLVRANLPPSLSSSSGKESKKKSLNAFIAKARRVFQALVTYSIAEIINASDALVAPIRMGMVKPTLISLSTDVLDAIERYLNTEQNLSTLLSNLENATETLNKLQKKRVRDDVVNSANASNNIRGDSDSDSESDNDDQPTRRLNSQSSVGGIAQDPAAERSHPLSNRERRVAASKRQKVTAAVAAALEAGDSTDSISSPSGGESESEDEEEDEESNEYGMARDMYNTSTNRIASEENNEDDEDEDEREIDDEEEDAYFNMEDEEEVESNGDRDETEPINPGDPAESAFIDPGDVTVELSDFSQPMDAQDNVGNSRRQAEDYSSSVSAAEEDINPPVVVDENNQSVRHMNIVTHSHDTSGSTLNWAVHQVRNESENAGTHQADVERGENRVNANAESSITTTAMASQAANSSAVSSRMRFRSTNADANGSDLNSMSGQTGMQLAMAFSVLVKLAYELLFELTNYKEWCKKGQKGLNSMLTLDENIVDVLKKCVADKLQPTWDWLYIVMDRMEAKLKFGNSLMSSSVGPLLAAAFDFDKSSKSDSAVRKDDKHRHRKNGKVDSKRPLLSDADLSQSANRSESCGYFLSLLRSHSAENGDDLPVIEYNSLKAVAFVIETYLFHVSLQHNLESDEPQAPKNDISTMDASKMRRFYQRSKSICYPHISVAESHHAFKYSAGECLPLSTKPHLLKPDADRSVWFALPVPHRTRNLHEKTAKEHGTSYPTHQSLADPPLTYVNITSRLRQDVEPIDMSSAAPQGSQQDELERLFSFDLDSLVSDRASVSRLMLQKCLGRWGHTAYFLSETFHEYIISGCGGDASLSVLLSETALYHVCQSQFRRRMEKFKASQTKELVFSHMSRERNALISSTIKQLNQNFARRNASSTPSNNSNTADGASNPVLASNKVKVTFQDEPGEGTGVARSFYSAVAEAIMSMQNLPTDLAAVNEDGTTNTEEFVSGNGGSGSSSSDMWGSALSRRPPQSTSPTRNFFSRLSKRTIRQVSEGNVASESSLPDYRMRTRSQRSTTGTTQPIRSGSSSTVQQISSTRRGNKIKTEDSLTKSTDNSKKEKLESTTVQKDLQSLPLFYKPSKFGYYTPIPGDNSPTRLNAFRNVGRIIGLCLQQMEIFPMSFCRHVLKYILGREITWFDLAFYDHDLFNSLRLIVFNDVAEMPHDPEHFENLYLSFAVDGKPEEGEEGQQALKPDGDKIAVSKENVLEYIYLFIQHRLLGNHIKCLDAIRRGVFDVIPVDALDQLTSEDVRLILCGNQDISVALLESYTTFSDESSAAAEVLTKYKQWFWSAISKFNNVEKQLFKELIFFWTGSPSLPSTEQGFQPLPSIMIRPADDHHLPTANTCISRLYLPLYSSKKILRAKLLLAIKARNFGFV